MGLKTNPSRTGNPSLVIRRLRPRELRDCGPLAKQQFGFTEAEQVPAWLMHTTGEYGGVTLGAFVGERLVAYSYALSGYDGSAPFLLSCGLAVAREFESQGIGEALKLAQRKHARVAGYEIVRWTTNSLASRPLYLYLSKLGARLVRYRQAMTHEVQDTIFPDEVEIEWRIARDTVGTPRAREVAPVPLTTSRMTTRGVRDLTNVDHEQLREPGSDAYTVELPWDRHLLERHSKALANRWVRGVRTAMQGLLEEGYIGTAVLPDRSRQRSFVLFDRATRLD